MIVVGGIYQIFEHGVYDWSSPEAVIMHNFLSCPLINLSTMNMKIFLKRVINLHIDRVVFLTSSCLTSAVVKAFRILYAVCPQF